MAAFRENDGFAFSSSFVEEGETSLSDFHSDTPNVRYLGEFLFADGRFFKLLLGVVLSSGY